MWEHDPAGCLLCPQHVAEIPSAQPTVLCVLSYSFLLCFLSSIYHTNTQTMNVAGWLWASWRRFISNEKDLPCNTMYPEKLHLSGWYLSFLEELGGMMHLLRTPWSTVENISYISERVVKGQQILKAQLVHLMGWFINFDIFSKWLTLFTPLPSSNQYVLYKPYSIADSLI